MTIFAPKDLEERIEGIMMLMLIGMALIFLTTEWDITFLVIVFFILFAFKEIRQKIKYLWR